MDECKIDTGEHGPIKIPPPRVSPVKKLAIDKKVRNMLDKNVIEQSQSPWTAPVVLVTKSDGSIQFCLITGSLIPSQRKTLFHFQELTRPCKLKPMQNIFLL